LKTIALSQKEFDALPEYSCSLPTGTPIGKRWKCGWPYKEPRTNWYLGEYVACAEPGMVGIVWREIVFVSKPGQPFRGRVATYA
jgi:hypothetical protein